MANENIAMRQLHAPPHQLVAPSASRARASDPGSKKKRVQRAHGGKQGDKGLRHFSMKVCEKVEQKGRTTYNEVADELVAEFAVAAQEGTSPLDQAYDEKNIRRCVLAFVAMPCPGAPGPARYLLVFLDPCVALALVLLAGSCVRPSLLHPPLPSSPPPLPDACTTPSTC